MDGAGGRRRGRRSTRCPASGPTIAEAVAAGSAHRENRILVARLAKHGVRMDEPDAAPAAGGPLEGKVLRADRHAARRCKRARRRALIEAAGGRVTGWRHARRPTRVVAGDEAGSKLDKAKAARDRNHRRGRAEEAHAMETQTLTLGRRSLHQLRSALERSLGVQAAPLLQEAGFASGEAMTARAAGYVQPAVRRREAAGSRRGVPRRSALRASSPRTAGASWRSASLAPPW